MSNFDNNDKYAQKTSILKIAEDDAVWLYRTSDPDDLVDLLYNPYEWVKRIIIDPGHGEPKRSARLLENFVISMDVATSDESTGTAEYLIDGIDSTSLITVRMATVGGRFNFKSGIDFSDVAKRILDMKPEFVFAQSGERCFFHLPLGTDPIFKKAILCAAIENQSWLCDLYGQLAVKDMHEADRQEPLPGKLQFKMITQTEGPLLSDAPQVDIIYQGSEADLDTVDACNVGSGTYVEQVVYIDGVAVKSYAPAPPSTPGG